MAKTINVNKLIEEEYVYLYPYNYYINHSSGASSSVQFFRKEFNKQKQMLLAKLQDRKILKSELTQAQSQMGISTMEVLNSSNLTNSFYHALAEELNTILADKTSMVSQFNAVLEGQDFGKALGPKNTIDVSALQGFCQAVVQAERILNGATSQDFNNALAAIYNYAMGKKSVTVIENYSAIIQANDALRFFANAANRLRRGHLTEHSFSSTVANVFSTYYGELIQKKAVEVAVEKLSQKIKQTMGKSIGGITIASMEINGGELIRTNLSSSSSAKPDFGGLLNMDVLMGDQQLTCQIDFNFSAKQYKGLSNGMSDSIKVISSSPLGRYLHQDEISNPFRFHTYNIIAHNESLGHESDDTYRSMRNFLAISFFEEWLTGHGGLVSQGNVANKAQFFIANGHIYSMQDIIRQAILETEATSTTATSGIVVSIPRFNKNKNQKIPGPMGWSAITTQLSRKRAEATRAAIDKIVISSKFNKRILS